MIRTSLYALAALLASGAALAQDFETLAPGNQKIARALFDAQIAGAEGNLSLDDIASLKEEGGGWGEIFQQMQADGQIQPDAKNLGQLVSGHYQPPSQGAVAEGGGEVVAADTGSFDSLSPGNRKIARALYVGQPIDAVTGEPVEGSLTLDQIAEMKQEGGGWGEIFQRMQADGQIPPDAKNLGQLVSGHYQPPAEPTLAGGEGEIAAATAKPARGRSEIVITTGSGQRVVVAREHGANGPKVVTGAGRSGDTAAAGRGRNDGGGRRITVTTGAGDAVGPGQVGRAGKVEVVTAGGAPSHGGGHAVHVTTGAGAAAAGGGGHALGHDRGASGSAPGQAR